MTKRTHLCIASTTLALISAVLPAAVQTSELSYRLLTLESQTWWKPQTGTVGVLTPERAAEYAHVHLRMSVPAFQSLPLETTFVPSITTILHDSYGYIDRVDSAFAPVRSSDRIAWPVPPATGEPELTDTRTYPPYTVSEFARLLTVQAPFKDTLNIEESRFVRLVFQLGSSAATRGLRTASWMKGLRLGLGERGYKNVSSDLATILPVTQGPLAGWWRVRFSVHESSGGHLHNVTVTVDPNFHALDPAQKLGTIIWQDVNLDATPHIVYIDTTTLSNGVHRLAIIGDDEGQTSAGALANVQQIWFEVEN